jgi:hypothetical protein
MINNKTKAIEGIMEWSKFRYAVRRSRFSKNYAYLIEIESDSFGKTETAITRPLGMKELKALAVEILNVVSKKEKLSEIS